MTRDFTSPVVVVVGAGGIGAAVAALMLKKGWDAILCTRREARIDAISRSLLQYTGSGSLHFCAGDPLFPPAKLWKDVASVLLGSRVIPRIHVIVSTGHYDPRSAFELTEATVQEDVASHVVPAGAAVKFAKHLYEEIDWGKPVGSTVIADRAMTRTDVTFLGSTLSYDGCIDAAGYIIAKHALLGLYRAVQCDAFGLPIENGLHYVALDNVKTPLWGSLPVPNDASLPEEAAQIVYEKSILERKIKVGIVMLDRKVKKLQLDTRLAELGRKKNVFIKILDLSAFSGESSEEIDVDIILHKITDHISQNDPRIGDFKKYCDEHPEVILLDELTNVEVLLDRDWMTESPESDLFSFPKTTILRAGDDPAEVMREKGIELPVLLKPFVGCGKEVSHRLILVNKMEGFASVEPVDYVVQEFINHSGIVYKCYVIHRNLHIMQKQSIRDMRQQEEEANAAISFNSQEPIANYESLCVPGADGTTYQSAPPEIRSLCLGCLDVLVKRMKLSLFGFDLIITKDRKLYVVDINYFPGYKGIESFFDELLDLFRHFK